MSKAKQENEGLRQKKDGVQADHSRALIAVRTMHKDLTAFPLFCLFLTKLFFYERNVVIPATLPEEENVSRVELSKIWLCEHEGRSKCNGALTSRDGRLRRILGDGTAR